jgi:hypothetical protein
MSDTTFRRAAAGDLDAQRQMISDALTLKRMRTCTERAGLEWALFWARLVITRGTLADHDRYEQLLYECTLEAQSRGDVEEVQDYMAEQITGLNARAANGDAGAALRLETIVANVSSDVLDHARSLEEFQQALDGRGVTPCADATGDGCG